MVASVGIDIQFILTTLCLDNAYIVLKRSTELNKLDVGSLVEGA